MISVPEDVLLPKVLKNRMTVPRVTAKIGRASSITVVLTGRKIAQNAHTKTETMHNTINGNSIILRTPFAHLRTVFRSRRPSKIHFFQLVVLILMQPTSSQLKDSTCRWLALYSSLRSLSSSYTRSIHTRDCGLAVFILENLKKSWFS